MTTSGTRRQGEVSVLPEDVPTKEWGEPGSYPDKVAEHPEVVGG